MKQIPRDLMIEILTRQILAFQVLAVNSTGETRLTYSKTVNRLRAKKSRLIIK